MSDNLLNEFVESARNYSDAKLINTIEQSFNFSKEKVEAAKIVAKERNLISDEQLSEFGSKKKLMRDAKSKPYMKLLRLQI